MITWMLGRNRLLVGQCHFRLTTLLLDAADLVVACRLPLAAWIRTSERSQISVVWPV